MAIRRIASYIPACIQWLYKLYENNFWVLERSTDVIIAIYIIFIDPFNHRQLFMYILTIQNSNTKRI